MLGEQQNTLLERTAVAAAEAIPSIPEFTDNEATVWCQAVENRIQSCCQDGKSTAILTFTTRSDEASDWWAPLDRDPRYSSGGIFNSIPEPPPVENEGESNKVQAEAEATWKVQVVPLPLRRWWHSLGKKSIFDFIPLTNC